MAVPHYTTIEEWPGQTRSRNGWERDWEGVLARLDEGMTVALEIPVGSNPEHYRSTVSGSFRTHGRPVETTIREGLLYIRKQPTATPKKRARKAAPSATA